MHWTVQETHNGLTGVGANVLNHAAVLTDQDALLGGFFDQNSGVDFHAAIAPLLQRFDLHSYRVRHLFMGAQHHLLANEFGDEEALITVSGHILRKVGRSFWYIAQDTLEQLWHPLTASRRQGHNLGEGRTLFVGSNQG